MSKSKAVATESVPKGGSNLQLRMESARQIALMEEQHLKPLAEMRSRKIVHPGMRDRAVLDSFRELRTRLLQYSHGENFIAMISPVSPGSGNSFTAANLAAAFALDDTKTALLVDCNMRHPTQHMLLGVDYEHGLTDHIEDPEMVPIEKVIYATGIRRLRLVPVGKRRESTSDHFASAHLEAFFSEVRMRYADRFILVDAPSIIESPDARMLADLSDMVVLCVTYGKSTRAQIAQVAADFGEDKLAGVVFSEGG